MASPKKVAAVEGQTTWGPCEDCGKTGFVSERRFRGHKGHHGRMKKSVKVASAGAIKQLEAKVSEHDLAIEEIREKISAKVSVPEKAAEPTPEVAAVVAEPAKEKPVVAEKTSQLSKEIHGIAEEIRSKKGSKVLF